MHTKALQHLVHSTPPRCLRRLRAKRVPVPAKWGNGVAMRWDVAAAWRLACRCGSGEGALLGHPLAALSPEAAGDHSFVSPFAFRCARCGKTTKILDTDVDGTGAELAKLDGDDIGCAAYRGAGRKRPFPCPKCGTPRGETVVALFFTKDYMDDLEDDGIAFAFENLFSGVRIYYRCSGCGKRTMVTDIDTKY
ncbi:MAG: hypothetical protein J2P46_07125 [Zavarzinella sp.]|nr:hypothetical protein [Zavarzinella sp.]